MNKLKTLNWLFTFVVLIAISCNAFSGQDNLSGTDNKESQNVTDEASGAEGFKGDLSDKLDCGIDAQFKTAILKNNFTIVKSVRIEKSDIPNISDNIKSIKRIYVGKEEVFDSFSTLSRFSIKNTKSKVSANLYCFKFRDASMASNWFDVMDKAGSLSERLPVLRRPKKLMALANDKVFLVEGYHISTFDSLRFILDKIPNKQAILGPEKTTRLKN